MFNILRKLFIKDYNNINDTKVRDSYGKLASIFGLLTNILLFIVKLIIGIISNSISIIADSINNLSDLTTSIVMLLGFKMSAKPADKEHPYGHQRIEYISGLIVSIFVIMVGVSLLTTSINKLIYYEDEVFSNTIIYVSIGILSFSILVKLYQSLFYHKISKTINSIALEASSEDSRNDVISTAIILIGYIIYLCIDDIPFSLDGLLGILVSIFIVISGIIMIKETTNPLIGSNDNKFLNQILDDVKKYNIVLNYHDPMCHTYGPTKCYMTLHIEVDASLSVIEIHEQIDDIEREIKKKYGVDLLIHMDPVRLNDEETNMMKEVVNSIIHNIDASFKLHDFRIAKKNGFHTLYFDLVIPYKYKLSDIEIENIITKELEKEGYSYKLYIDVDYE